MSNPFLVLATFGVCLLCGWAFGVWQDNAAAGVFMALFTTLTARIS